MFVFQSNECNITCFNEIYLNIYLTIHKFSGHKSDLFTHKHTHIEQQGKNGGSATISGKNDGSATTLTSQTKLFTQL